MIHFTDREYYILRNKCARAKRKHYDSIWILENYNRLLGILNNAR